MCEERERERGGRERSYRLVNDKDKVWERENKKEIAWESDNFIEPVCEKGKIIRKSEREWEKVKMWVSEDLID